MVPFNVVPMAQGRFHRAHSVTIVIGARARMVWITLLSKYAMTRSPQVPRSRRFQWGKLLLTLKCAQCPVGADLVTKQASQPAVAHACLAEQLEEALGSWRAHGCAVNLQSPCPWGWCPISCACRHRCSGSIRPEYCKNRPARPRTSMAL